MDVDEARNMPHLAYLRFRLFRSNSSALKLRCAEKASARNGPLVLVSSSVRGEKDMQLR